MKLIDIHITNLLPGQKATAFLRNKGRDQEIMMLLNIILIVKCIGFMKQEAIAKVSVLLPKHISLRAFTLIFPRITK